MVIFEMQVFFAKYLYFSALKCFKDFKKALHRLQEAIDRLWHEPLWASVMKQNSYAEQLWTSSSHRQCCNCKTEELKHLIDTLNKNTQAYKMEIKLDQTKVMTNTHIKHQLDLRVNGTNLETDNRRNATLGYHCLNEGSKPEIMFRIALTTAAVAKLKNIWKDDNISDPLQKQSWCAPSSYAP